ncbi:hypothetical protein [uncultured Thiothrix sp.]|uniref:hypothetical protein n=1 Tax=uncultured Thiothrix sp. TaxID=223185 RepID=UPI00262BBCD5|nr:hypothetical protein [uncultured Thiothrix sp.]
MSEFLSPIKASTNILDLLDQQDFQEQQATRLTEAVFGDEQNTEKTGILITKFVRSYEKHKNDMTLETWLVKAFQSFPSIWKDQDELSQTARELISTVENNNAAKVSLYNHLEAGKSRETWLATKLEEGAAASGVANVGQYASEIDKALNQANEAMAKTVTTQSGNINMGRNLDGFLAEQHHVDTFNLEAAAQGSGYLAKVLSPNGDAYGKNSMDIGIYDQDGKLLKRYQAKYGQNADSTSQLFEKGDYRGQRKLGPADQIDQLNNATDSIEIDGISSKPLTKEQAKALQEQAQIEQEIRQYEWNDVNRVQIAKEIGKGAVIAAGLTAGSQGLRILGRRAWNFITGKQNQPVSEDLKEFFESSIKSASHVGTQVAVSGAVLVAAKSGWMGTVLKSTPAGRLADIAYLSMENAKILYKYAKGELSGVEALDAMGTTNTSLVGGLMGAVKGVALGATLGTVLGPVGSTVGGLVGGVVGGMAGSKIGQAVYEGGKKIVTTAVKAVQSVGRAITTGAKAVASKVGSFVSKLFG